MISDSSDESLESEKSVTSQNIAGGSSGFPSGPSLLHNPELNKGTAFTLKERRAFDLRGLLPPHVLSEEMQEKRALEVLAKKPNDLERFIYLNSMQERNETLFFRVVMNHLRELMPIIYTPTVGQVCEQFGHIFRRPHGMWISAEDSGSIHEVLGNWPRADEVRIIVVTDGERILGLGDLGADGMGIPVGKLNLYTACAGVHPRSCLPITLDVGTNNSDLREDPLYVGLSKPRLTGQEYDSFIDEFMVAARSRFPKALIQLEDFANHHAFELLARYRQTDCLFDDDIQGTGSVILAGLLASQRLNGMALEDHRFLFLGAGEAVIGICSQIVASLVHDGMDEAEAKSHCWIIDSRGLVVRSRDDLVFFKQPFAQDHAPIRDLEEAIRTIKPTALIGACGQPHAFTQPVIEAMAELNQQPVIFALSNPTSKAECTAQQAYEWTEGRAIFASGSPFDPVVINGRSYDPGQGNNAYIFPGVGLGVIACQARHITDKMFYAAAKALSMAVTDEDINSGRVYPALERIREVSVDIAAAVCEVAYDQHLARRTRPVNLHSFLRKSMYEPVYRDYV
jgi:malate dehydrogenase (oxaloacetate-decarboxylating)(NADP+)